LNARFAPGIGPVAVKQRAPRIDFFAVERTPGIGFFAVKQRATMIAPWIDLAAVEQRAPGIGFFAVEQRATGPGSTSPPSSIARPGSASSPPSTVRHRLLRKRNVLKAW
jgi:hypothetical protein